MEARCRELELSSEVKRTNEMYGELVAGEIKQLELCKEELTQVNVKCEALQKKLDEALEMKGVLRYGWCMRRRQILNTVLWQRKVCLVAMIPEGSQKPNTQDYSSQVSTN